MNKKTINMIVYALIAVLLIVLVTMLVMFLVNRGGEKEFKDDLTELRNDMKTKLSNVTDSDIDDIYTLNKELVQAIYRNRNTREIFQNLLKNIENDECRTTFHKDLLTRLQSDANLDHILHDIFNGVKGCEDISGKKSEVRISMMLLLVVLMRMNLLNKLNLIPGHNIK